jgi:aminopeptidase N
VSQSLKSFFIPAGLFIVQLTSAQFSKQDTLRGSNGPGRAWWDVMSYEITVTPDYGQKKISGKTIIQFTANKSGYQVMQIDLQEPLMIDSIKSWDKKQILFKKTSINTWDLYIKNLPEKNHSTPKIKNTNPYGNFPGYKIEIFYHGTPCEARRPPWDGGWIFSKDAQGRPWMSVACQGVGASVWYPCKDYQGDEPDFGATLTIDIPDTLVAVANGRLKEKKSNNGNTSWTWEVKNPINNYNIIPYIGKYVHWNETYEGEKGKLDCSYWVLDYNLEKAKEQFKQAAITLKAFEYWFGPYPFYEDGFKLVEAPHLGMEHQSAVAYGNGFQNGYRGRDLSGSGWGLKWDFIIVHEVGHEWFGNNITTVDIADMWVHEGFTNYSETLFTEYHYGKEAANDYCTGTRQLIQNDRPIIGPYGVNRRGSGDMYYKGGNMLHTIRQVINDDKTFREIVRGLNKDFYHQAVTSKNVEDYMSEKSGSDLSKIFDQYLRTVMIPVLEYKISSTSLSFRWRNCVDGFDMRVKLSNGDWLDPIPHWKEIPLNENMKRGIEADRNFYIAVQKVE